MRLAVVPLVVCALLVGAGCRDGGARKVDVVAGFYPLAEAAARVGGDRVHVRNLTAAGADPRDVELSGDDVDAVHDAALVLDMGRGFQPALEDATSRRDGLTVEVLDGLRVVGDDPHVWLDPQAMVSIVRLVNAALDKVSPNDAPTFDANADFYVQKLLTLSRELGIGLHDCVRRTIVTADGSFGWFARAYHLDQRGLAAVGDLVDRQAITTVFTEVGTANGSVRSLAREAGLKVRALDPVERVDPGAGADYLSVMRRNLATLQAALACTA